MYELPPLPYDYSALEPYIDARTMQIHHAQHHAGYVRKLNRLLEGYEGLAKMPLEDMIADIRMLPEEIRQAIRDNGGGHLNHSLFWEIMAPHKGGEPTGVLREAITGAFVDLPSFKEALTSAALNRFGSGWAWLCLDHRNRLEVVSTPNQDSPIMLGYRPILGIDVWEHAYYLKYQNRRAEYVAAWWNVLDWQHAERNFAG